MNIDFEGTLLRLGNDRELFIEFIQIFREDSPQRVQAIRDAFEKGDLYDAGQAAHSLRGLAANLGATKVVSAAYALETLAASGEATEWRLAFQTLTESFALAEDELSKLETVSLGSR